MKLPRLLFPALLGAFPQCLHADLPVVDDFEDGVLNPALWTSRTDIMTGEPSVTEEDGGVALKGRGHLVTAEEFDPEETGGLVITGEWVFGQKNDFLSVLTRSDGTPSGDFGETRSGVEFFVNTDFNTITIRTRSADHVIGNVMKTDGLIYRLGTPYRFVVTDDGRNNLTFLIEEIANPTNRAFALATLTSDNSSMDFVVFHNREGTRTSLLNDVNIRAINDTDDDGMDDDWELANELMVGIDDSGDDADGDFLSNGDEFLYQSDPQVADSDSDFSEDGDEVTIGTDLNNPDSDFDGLLDGYETNNGEETFVSAVDTGSNPVLFDTDGDGVGDGLEVLRGTDPTSAADGPTGLEVGLLSYWNFDGDLTDVAHLGFTSSSRVPDDGEFVGPDTDVSIVDEGKFGQSLLQNGEQGWVKISPSMDTIRSDNNMLSLSAWFRVDAFDRSWQTLVAHGEGSQFRIARQGSDSALSYAGGAADIFGGSDLVDTEWHHIVAITEGGVSVRLYIDGVLESTGNSPAINEFGSNTESMVPDLLIGANPQAENRAWEGGIDDVGLWNRALTPEEITEIYNGGEGVPIGTLLEQSNPPSSDIDVTSFTVDDMGKLNVVWTATPGRTYRIVYSPDLTEGSFTGVLASSIDSADPLAIFVDGNVVYGPLNNPLPEATKLFFRVEAE